MNQVWLWGGFTVFVLGMLAIDLGVVNRKVHTISTREAGIWCIVWISLAAVFGAGVYYFMGRQAALEFAAGYLVEEALSVDNLFVFLLIFSYFRVPPLYQHRVLFWGILGALVMRGGMIGIGAVLIERFHWIIYVFGAFLVITGVRMATQGDQEIEPDKNPVLKLVRRLLPVTREYREQKFFVRESAKPGAPLRLYATPLFVVLVLVETTDLVFAVDSIPAIFAVTRDPFLVYTSNVFAILGLRALYFVLAGAIAKFHFLRYGLSAVLSFVGVKMLLSNKFHIPIGISLGVIAGLLLASVLASVWFAQKEPDDAREAPDVASVDGPVDLDGDGLDDATGEPVRRAAP
jgi:tellurite resistance protein TerC